jgi:biopolymer transport protein ExbB/TolQ
MRGGKIVEGIGTGIGLVIALIAFLEMCRFFRWIIKLPREIDDLKRKVSNLEEFIKNSNG